MLLDYMKSGAKWYAFQSHAAGLAFEGYDPEKPDRKKEAVRRGKYPAFRRRPDLSGQRPRKLKWAGTGYEVSSVKNSAFIFEGRLLRQPY